MKAMLICFAGHAALGSAATAAWAQPSASASATAALAQGSTSSVQGPVLVLSVQAHEEVTEDTAHAMLAVERESRDAAEAQRQAAAVLRDALDAAKRERERELTVITDGFRTIPVYDKAGRISHYRAHAGLRIESRELATVARMAAQLSSIMQIRSSYFSVSR